MISNQAKMKYIVGELHELRAVLGYLMDGNMEAFGILMYIKQTYKDWGKMILWLKQNNLRGQKLVEFFQNESPDGGGYMLGCELILSRMRGNKNSIDGMNIRELS